MHRETRQNRAGVRLRVVCAPVCTRRSCRIPPRASSREAAVVRELEAANARYQETSKLLEASNARIRELL